MALDPQVQKVLDNANANGSSFNWMDHKKARDMLDKMFLNDGSAVPVGSVEDRFVPCPWGSLPVRIYTPEGSGPFPVLVFFHGGGWVTNNIETHDSVCRHITRLSECIVVSVDYRRPPEHKFPQPVEDAYAATRWVLDNAGSFGGDPCRIAVGGDSSGGNLAAAVCLLNRDRGGPAIRLQVLIYPVTDYYLPGTSSLTEFGSGYVLSRDLMIWCWNHYLQSDEDINNPYICPLRASSFAGLPPALLITAGYDPLRDEGEAYAKKLQNAGVEVLLKQYEDMVHGFILHWRVYDRAMEALRLIGEEIKKAL